MELAAAQGVDQRDRSVVDGDAFGLKDVEDQGTFAVPEPFHRSSVLRVVVVTLEELDVSGGEEVLHAVLTRFAVDVALVVAHGIEGSERRVGAGRLLDQETVERLLAVLREWALSGADHPLTSSARTAASLMSARLVAVISVRIRWLATSRRCWRASARSGSSSSFR